MGTPVPIAWPKLEDAKYYRANMHCFFDETEKTGCDQTYVCEAACCKSGLEIKNWLAGGYECMNDYGLCIPEYLLAQRLICCYGPYDTLEDCILGL